MCTAHCQAAGVTMEREQPLTSQNEEMGPLQLLPERVCKSN